MPFLIIKVEPFIPYLMKPSSGIEKILFDLHTAPKYYNGTSLNYQHMEFKWTPISLVGVKGPLRKNKRIYFSGKVILQFSIACFSSPSITEPLKETSPALMFDVFEHSLSTLTYAKKERCRTNWIPMAFFEEEQRERADGALQGPTRWWRIQA